VTKIQNTIGSVCDVAKESMKPYQKNIYGNKFYVKTLTDQHLYTHIRIENPTTNILELLFDMSTLNFECWLKPSIETCVKKQSN